MGAARIDPGTFDPVDRIASGVLYFFAAGAVSFGCSQLQHVGITVFVRALLCLSTARLAWSIASGVAFARHVASAIRHLPGPKQSTLGVVDLFARRPDIHRALTELADDHGPIFKMRALIFRFVVVTDPALANYCLRLPAVDKFGFAYSFLQKLMGGANVLTGQSDQHWRTVRKGVAPAFSASRMRDACKGIASSAEQLVQILHKQGGKACNVDVLLLRAGIDYVGQLGFGKDMGGLAAVQADKDVVDDDAAVMLASGHELAHQMTDPLRRLKLWQPDVLHGIITHWKFKGICKGVVDHAIKHTPPAGSFAQLLLATINPVTGAPYQGRLRAESSALFSAGADTTAHTITWALFQLSQHPEAEHKVVAELQALGLLATAEAPVPRLFSSADLSKLPYLTLVIKETLRMNPAIGVGQLRVCTTDTNLAGQMMLPAGTVLWMPHHAIQNSHLNWDKPDIFLPERFEQPGAEQADASKLKLAPNWYKALGYDPATGGPAPAKRYMPFGEGPRNCLGQNFAHTSMLTILATLLGRFHFRLAAEMGGKEGVKARVTMCIVTAVQNGMWMHAEPRV